MNTNLIYNDVIILDQTGIAHGRKKYGLLDLLGDLGGILEVVMLATGFMLFPISEHSFVMKASHRLFYARSDSDKIFKKHEDRLKDKFI